MNNREKTSKSMQMANMIGFVNSIMNVFEFMAMIFKERIQTRTAEATDSEINQMNVKCMQFCIAMSR